MNVFVIMDILAVIYIIVGAVLGVLVYVTPESDQSQEVAEMVDETPSRLTALACVVIAVIWPYAVYKVLTDLKARK